MESVFVNLTNHPSKAWDRAQIDAAEKYGQIVDLPFPKVASDKDEEYIKALSDKCVEKVMELNPAAVLCQGEFTLVYRIVSELRRRDVTVLAACSERRVVEKGNEKVSVFCFDRFREFVD